MKTFEEAWAEKEADGFQYGPDALEQVRLGWDMRVASEVEGATIEGEIVEAVVAWFERMKKVKDTHNRTLTIRLSDRQCDEDDETLYLDATIEETGYTEIGGRVPGVKF